MCQLMPNLWESDQASYTDVPAEPSQVRQIQEEIEVLLPMAKKLVVQLERSQALISGKSIIIMYNHFTLLRCIQLMIPLTLKPC